MPDKHRAIFWECAQEFDRTYGDDVNEHWFKGEYWPYLKNRGMEIYVPQAEETAKLLEVGKPIWEWWKKDIGEDWGQKAIDLAYGKG